MRDTFHSLFRPSVFLLYSMQLLPPASCETIVARVRALLEADPELLVLLVDMANAFNEVDRVMISVSRSSGLTFLLCFLLLESFTITPALCSTGDRMAPGRHSSLALDHARAILSGAILIFTGTPI
jgi:hypothetical protein